MFGAGDNGYRGTGERKATAGLAMKVGVTPTDIQDFIKGSANYGMTKRLGLPIQSAASELAKLCGREGAIGIVMGLPFPG
jgi:hypothetical protein